MTIIYFIRHAEPDLTIHDEMTRPLTANGLLSSNNVTKYLIDKNIHQVFSSPYLRAVQTVQGFADELGLEVITIEDFRERKIDDVWIEDFMSFVKEQWNDYDYKLSNGESLRETQVRNIVALEALLQQYQGKNLVIATHGTALSTMIQYYYKDFGYEDFYEIRCKMPWIVKMEFEEKICKSIMSIDILEPSHSSDRLKQYI